jgi:hypothetical protein
MLRPPLRAGRRHRPDPADPHARCPLLQGDAGDDRDDDLQERLDEDDPSACELQNALKRARLATWHKADQNPLPLWRGRRFPVD